MTVVPAVFLVCDVCRARSDPAERTASLREHSPGWQRVSEPARVGRSALTDLCPACADRAVPSEGVRAGRCGPVTAPGALVVHVTLDGRTAVCGRPPGPLLPESLVPAGKVPEDERCHLPGCDGWWTHPRPGPRA